MTLKYKPKKQDGFEISRMILIVFVLNYASLSTIIKGHAWWKVASTAQKTEQCSTPQWVDKQAGQLSQAPSHDGTTRTAQTWQRRKHVWLTTEPFARSTIISTGKE